MFKTRVPNLLKTTLLLSAMAALAPSAQAQAFDVVRLYGASVATDTGTVGGAFVAGRQYAGSREHRYMLVPLIDYQWKSGWFAGTLNGIGYDFSRRPDMNYGLRLTADLGRLEERSVALRGLGDIDIRPEAGAFFNYYVSPQVALTSSLRYGSGNERSGMVIDIGAAYSAMLAPQWRVGLGVTGSYVNADYMQAYFGVTPTQSARSGYAITTPSAGLRDIRASAALTYLISPRVSVTTGVSASSLLGDAKDSPLLRERNAVSGLVSVLYRF
ncbi:MAG: MipA/OmpV family protein [Polaromonas sp.]|nr:MipA/OmpV family protein [Polaromonas sp.]